MGDTIDADVDDDDGVALLVLLVFCPGESLPFTTFFPISHTKSGMSPAPTKLLSPARNEGDVEDAIEVVDFGDDKVVLLFCCCCC